jgi:hypothetical protein
MKGNERHGKEKEKERKGKENMCSSDNFPSTKSSRYSDGIRTGRPGFHSR